MAATLADAPPIAVHRTGSGPPVVLLHCLGVDHRFWDFADGLADEFALLRYDLPGHGATPVPAAPYDIGDLSKQLAGLFRRHDLAHAHVVGISLGGLIAQHFAATWPGLVDRLVLIDTTPRYTDELRRMWAERAAIARKAGVAAMVDGLLQIWFTPEFVAANGPAVRYVRTTLARTSGEGYALACEALAAADLRPLAPQIAAPTLVLCGADDIASFLDAARWLAGNIRGARLAWLPGARHASVLERPAQAVELMREFLKAP
jgi:3-oxoadipate enol-lactonase